jgi:hypothetical protein
MGAFNPDIKNATENNTEEVKMAKDMLLNSMLYFFLKRLSIDLYVKKRIEMPIIMDIPISAMA